MPWYVALFTNSVSTILKKSMQVFIVRSDIFGGVQVRSKEVVVSYPGNKKLLIFSCTFSLFSCFSIQLAHPNWIFFTLLPHSYTFLPPSTHCHSPLPYSLAATPPSLLLNIASTRPRLLQPTLQPWKAVLLKKI